MWTGESEYWNAAATRYPSTFPVDPVAATVKHMRAIVLVPLLVLACDSKSAPQPTDPTAPPPGDAVAIAVDAPTPVLGPKAPDLVVTAVSPEHGEPEGGTYVVIKGRGFTQVVRTAKVKFGTRDATVIRFASDTELIVQAPAGTAGDSVEVAVEFAPGGTLRLADGFRYRETDDQTGGRSSGDTAMEEMALDLVLELGDIFTRAGKDCPKLATELGAYMDKHERDLKKYKDYEKSLSATAKQRFNRKMEQAMKPMMDKMMASMTACMSDPKVADALKRMADP